MTQRPDLERQGAQALLATYVQMARYAQLAKSLQQSRMRSIERRLDTAVENREVFRLQQQLDAQHSQGAVLEGAVGRFSAQTQDLAQFAESGVTFEDFEDLGVADLVNKKEVDEAVKRRAEARDASESPAASEASAAPSAATEDAPQTPPSASSDADREAKE